MKKLILILFLFAGCMSPEEFLKSSIINSGKNNQQLYSQKVKKPTQKEILDSWLGHTKNELLMKWGIPTRSTDDGNGGQVLAYEGRRTIGGFIFGNYIENTYTDFTEIFVDSKNIIYYWHIGKR
jgi:hypothetical protein